MCGFYWATLYLLIARTAQSRLGQPTKVTVPSYKSWGLVENFYPLVFGAPVGVKPSGLRNDLWWRKKLE